MTRATEATTAVIFDMDGVLCTYDLRIRLDLLAAHAGSTREAVHAAIWGSGFEDEADSGGYPDTGAYLASFASRLGVPVDLDTWIRARAAAMSPRPAMLDLVRALSARYTVAMLTNNGPATEEAFVRLFPEAASLFESRAFFSHRFGTKKPDPAIYRAVARELGVGTHACLFIDDKAHNVEGARRAGMSALHFTGEQACRTALHTAGIVA